MTPYSIGDWFIWQACEGCRKERWVSLKNKGKLIPYRIRCHLCASKLPGFSEQCSRAQKGKFGEKSGAWKGGRYESLGYIMVYISPDDFFSPMRSKTGYIREHRLVMAKSLRRCLLPWEVVHHKNGVKNDNRLENLELIDSNSRHNTQDKRYIRQLEKENGKLRERIQKLELLGEEAKKR